MAEPEKKLGRILLVDDEPEPLRATARVLRFAGYEVTTAQDGELGAQLIKDGNFDVIISDISMPGISGIELLKFAQTHDPDVPVILVTGAPAVETAVQALDYGAYKYLVKPVEVAKLEDAVQKAMQMSQMARIRKEAMKVTATANDPDLRAAFDDCMETLWMAFQPIVTREGELYGHEALMRSTEPRLPHPGAVLDAAERLDRLSELGRIVRKRAAAPAADSTNTGMLFVNLHPRDLEDEELVSPDAPLTAIADRVVLEITERASVSSIQDLRGRVAALREVGYRIAVDDLGAGYAGLTSFALLEPEIVKVDMSLVRDVDTLPTKQRLIRSMTSLCNDMGIKVVCEGVETEAERDALLELGCDLLQGYYLAKPDKPFPEFRW
jgi:EAL domain-containing protein (putative c-di-GMP-specific phosphodiesterase class I)